MALRDIRIVEGADIAVGRLDPVPPDMVERLPILKNPGLGIDPGTSLCRLGYAFTRVTSTFDEAATAFRVTGEVPFFPLEGMFTGSSSRADTRRQVPHPLHRDFLARPAGPQRRPALRHPGSRVGHPEPDAAPGPRLQPGGRDRRCEDGQVPQFINLGLAVHVGTLITILDEMSVAYEISPD